MTTLAERGALAARTYVALVHHPVYDRNQRIVTTAITNLDIHDIARSSRTYGCAGYLLVTPVAAQRELAARILGHWSGEAPDKDAHAASNDFRRDALSYVSIVHSVDEARARVAERAGSEPIVFATAARSLGRPLLPFEGLAPVAGDGRPLLLLFGTGWGLADEVLDRVDHLLAPIRGPSDYNHLSVRSAAAICLDRLFGDR